MFASKNTDKITKCECFQQFWKKGANELYKQMKQQTNDTLMRQSWKKAMCVMHEPKCYDSTQIKTCQHKLLNEHQMIDLIQGDSIFCHFGSTLIVVFD